MEASSGDTKTKTLKKPLLIIKRSSIFKHSSPLLLRTTLKRKAEENSEITAANTSNAADEPTSNTCATSSLQKNTILKETEKTNDLPKKICKKLQRVEELPENKNTNKIKAIKFDEIPKTKCQKHGNLPVLRAEGLLKVGDVFKSIEEFSDYVTEQAKQWFFYYMRFHSRNIKTSATYDSKKPIFCYYQCRFGKKHYTSQSKGIRKIREISTAECPASVTLRCDPGTDLYMVRDVCHHHSHELSAELFSQQPHGYRLPQHLKDEIRDLARFNVDSMLVRRYVESKTPGIALRKSIYNQIVKVRRQGSKDNMSPERIKEMLEKIRYIKANFDPILKGPSPKATKEPRKKPNSKLNERKGKTSKKVSQSSNDGIITKIEDERLSNKSPDHELIQSDTEQQKPACETQLNPWQEASPNDTDSNDENVKYEIEYEISTNASTKEATEDFEDSDEQFIIKNSKTGITNEQMRIGNSTTGILDIKRPIVEPETISDERMCIINPITGNLDERMPEVERETGISDEQMPSFKSEPQKMYNDENQPEDLIKARSREELRCQRRHSELPEYQAEGLIKIGDTFSSIEQFSRYSAAHALKWFFYYHVHDSRNVKTSVRYRSNRTTWYNYSCRFNTGEYRSQNKGSRKIIQQTMQCPATVSMRCKPGEDVFTVTYVCHHHSHELTPEIFSQEPHGHRLLPQWKNEIRELAWFRLDIRLIRQYLNAKTGFDLKRTIKNVIAKMKRERQKIKYVSPEKEKEILEKIEYIKQKFVIPKRAPPRSKNKNPLTDIPQDTKESDDEGNKSRVEARLNNILYDQELIQSVKELQETTGCEIRIQPCPCGQVNVIENGITDSQPGLIEEPGCNDTQHANDDDNENDSQIEIDQELYSMDDNVRYIIPSDQDGTNIFGVIDRVDNTSEECGENLIYIQKLESIEDVKNISVDSCDENVQYEVLPADDEIYYIDEADKIIQSNENIYIDKYNVEENTELPKSCQEAAFEYSNSENEYQTIYQYVNNEDSDIQDESSEHLNYAQQYSKEPYNSRDIGVQADLQIIKLESDNEKIKKLESIALRNDLGKSTHSCSTRGQPNTVLEEGIINRFNIEFYISHSGITTCLENLAVSMGLSVLDLLKKLYQGEAVFKMSVGRSGKQDRKTVQLAYVPLTIAFPFKNFKYMNGLQEYKTLCSKYSDVTIKLEAAVENMSNELNATKIQLENVELQNQQLLDKMESHQNLLNPQAQTEQLLKNCQAAQAVKNATSIKNKIDLQLAKEQNELLLKKIKELEDLQISSRLKDAEVLNQLLEPKFERHKTNRARIENKFLGDRIKELEEKSPANNINSLTEKIKMLEQAIEVSDADTKRHKEKIRKLEELYLSDSQSLLGKIKMLEDELDSLRTELSYLKKTENPSSCITRHAELENKRLRKEIKALEELKSSDNKQLIEKIKRLNNAVSSLNKRLNEQKHNN